LQFPYPYLTEAMT